MDPQTIGLADSVMQILSQASGSLAGTYTGNTLSLNFDMAFGATLVLGQYAPGAGGAALQVPVPIISYNAPNTLTFTATGGTYLLNVNGSGGVQTTTALAYNANAAAIAAALNALTNVSSLGTATVTGTGPFTITLPPGAQAFGNQANPLTINTVGLTGGSATLAIPTYTFTVNESSDGVTWRPASRAANPIQDNIPPTGDGFVMLMVQSRQRYLQLAMGISGTGASITIGPVYIQPFVNKFGA